MSPEGNPGLDWPWLTILCSGDGLHNVALKRWMPLEPGVESPNETEDDTQGSDTFRPPRPGGRPGLTYSASKRPLRLYRWRCSVYLHRMFSLCLLWKPDQRSGTERVAACPRSLLHAFYTKL